MPISKKQNRNDLFHVSTMSYEDKECDMGLINTGTKTSEEVGHS